MRYITQYKFLSISIQIGLSYQQDVSKLGVKEWNRWLLDFVLKDKKY